MTRNVFLIGSLGAALLCTGCGSDSSSPGAAPAPSGAAGLTRTFGPEGSWAGTIDTPTAASRNMQAAVLDDGTFWMVYFKEGSNGIGGILQGSGKVDHGTFTVSDATLLSLEDSVSGTADIAASFVKKSRLGGSITVDEGAAPALPSPATFSSLFQLSSNTRLTLRDLAGSFTGNITTQLGTESATVDISDSGAITGSNASGCSLSGQAERPPRGNIFKVDVRFGSETACGLNANVEVFGVVSLEVDKATVLAMDIGRSNSFIFTGLR
jgi:hypothetical protein